VRSKGGLARLEKKGVLPKILAVVGIILVWLPILAPVIFSAISMIGARIFRFDFLMPAELFLFALAGALLLLWAALRAKARRGLIGWGLGVAIVLLFEGQGLAVVTGMASGETVPAGWLLAVVLGMIAGYDLALVVVGVGGVLLLRDLWTASEKGA
jgi:hypothetical protein